MKKILSVLLLAAMMVGCIMPTLVSAADEQLNVAVKGPEKVSALDEAIDLSIELSGNDESGIWGMTLVVAYTKGWTASDMVNGGLWSDEDDVSFETAPAQSAIAKALKDFEMDAKAYDFAVIDLQKLKHDDAVVTANGTIATLKLNAPEGLVGGEKLDVKIIYDKNGPMTVEEGKVKDVVFTVDNYAVDIDAPPPVVTVSDVTGRVGSTVKVDIELSYFPAVKALNIEEITYDSSVLTLVEGAWAYSEDDENVALVSFGQDVSGETGADAGAATGAVLFNEAVDVNKVVFTATFEINAEITEATETVVGVVFNAKTADDADVAEIIPVSGTVSVITVKYGDVNDTGFVDSDDAIYLLECFMDGFAPEDYNQDVDFDKSGEIDSDDAVTLLEMFMDGMFDE